MRTVYDQDTTRRNHCNSVAGFVCYTVICSISLSRGLWIRRMAWRMVERGKRSRSWSRSWARVPWGALATASYYTAPYYGAPGYGYAPLQPYPRLGTGVIHYSNITHTCLIARLHGGKWYNRPRRKSSHVHSDASGGDRRGKACEFSTGGMSALAS
jgi:hypothetical protein